jgi:hypothetical protein
LAVAFNERAAGSPLPATPRHITAVRGNVRKLMP